MWNAGGPGAIIGVHSTGTGSYNYGSVFFDDKGLIELFGAENLKAHLEKCPSYEPSLQYGDFKY